MDFSYNMMMKSIVSELIPDVDTLRKTTFDLYVVYTQSLFVVNSNVLLVHNKQCSYTILKS